MKGSKEETNDEVNKRKRELIGGGEQRSLQTLEPTELQFELDHVLPYPALKGLRKKKKQRIIKNNRKENCQTNTLHGRNK